jgi:Tfp pilus assembly protein PilF
MKAATSAVALAALIAAAPAPGAPFRPAADDEVVETLPARATDPRMRELGELRQAWQRRPQDLDAAVRLARRYYEETAAEGDPRYVGYAQAVLAPWWNQPDPPPAARVMRAILLQFGHDFDAAIADLDGALRADPSNGEAWAWRAAIRLVQARYAEAREACERLLQHASPLVGTACVAQVDSLTGRAAAAAEAIRAALQRSADADAGERLWALTRLGEIEERRGRPAQAEEAYREALALDVADGYLLGAYADFLLDRGRPAEVVTLLKDRSRSDVLLLRLALAAKALRAPALAGWESDLAARFAAARLRGDKLHQKEESRFRLGVQGQVQPALALARENYALQREPADARVLLEAAVAARQPEAAEPVLAWMRQSGIESVVLSVLAQQLKGVR